MTLDRAYSLLTIKSIAPETRAFEGLATSPTPDRMGDIIDSKGATFANPIPLLLFHDHRRPVGTVTLGAATDAGIPFRATLPAIKEPGALRDRVDEAWQSVQASLIRGVSIGFRPLDGGIERLKETGGFRFTKTEILELSLVAVPANAEARIDTIKSLDAPHLARATSSTPPRSQSPMKTTQEQIAGFTAMRTAKAARMTELMTAAGEAGTVLDEAASTEYDGLAREVGELKTHLDRLAALETANIAAAKPAAGSTIKAASESRGHVPTITLRDNLPPGIEFTRAIMCKLVAFLYPGTSPVAEARARYPDNHRVHQYLERTAVPAHTTVNTSALIDQTNLTTEFLEWFQPQTIIGKFGQGAIPDLMRVPFNVGIAGQTSGGEGYWVGESKAKPLMNFTFDRTPLGFSKVAAISAISEELVRFSTPSAEMLIRNALRNALVARLDKDFVDPAKAVVANVSPASITNGVTPLTSSGTTADDIRTDIQALLGAFVSSNQDVTNVVIITTPAVGLALSLMRNALGQPEFPGTSRTGGTLEGLPLIVSQHAHTTAAGDMLIAANADAIALADDGQVTVDASREASLEMSDAPTGDAGAATPVATSLVSMWQTNSLALRAERFINWKKLRSGAVVYMEDVAWGGAAPGS